MKRLWTVLAGILVIHTTSAAQVEKLKDLFDNYYWCVRSAVHERRPTNDDDFLAAIENGLDTCIPKVALIRQYYGNSAAMEAYLRVRNEISFHPPY